jgi:hypothetical protein
VSHVSILNFPFINTPKPYKAMNSFEGQDAGNVRKVDANAYQLQGLRSLHDHELAEGVPDVRGWKVVDRNGDRIGRVDDLIVDPAAQAVRYIDVDLRDSVSPDDDKDYHLLIPVGTARLDDQDDCVHADNLIKDQLGSYPRATRGGINRTYENDVRTFYDNDTRSAGQYFGNSRTDDVIGDRHSIRRWAAAWARICRPHAQREPRRCYLPRLRSPRHRHQPERRHRASMSSELGDLQQRIEPGYARRPRPRRRPDAAQRGLQPSTIPVTGASGLPSATLGG